MFTAAIFSCNTDWLISLLFFTLGWFFALYLPPFYLPAASSPVALPYSAIMSSTLLPTLENPLQIVPECLFQAP